MDVDDRRGSARRKCDHLDAARGNSGTCFVRDSVQYGPDRPDVLFRALNMDGVFQRMLIPSEAETARRARTAAEKRNEVQLMRW